MARTNKFKKSKSTQADLQQAKATQTSDPPAFKKPANPAAPIVQSTTSRTHSREPTSSDDHARSRPRTSSKPWTDGDDEPRFASPAVPILTHPQQSAALSNVPELIAHTDRPTHASLLPPAIAASLTQNFDIHALHISEGAKINAKVVQLLDLLENGFDFGRTDQKPGVVALTAKGQAANKMISVVEIAKRELEKKRVRWLQYSALGCRVEEIQTKIGKINMGKENEGGGRVLGGKKNGDKDKDVEMAEAEEEEEEEEEAFETMVVKERKKVRAVPYLTVYMSRVPVQVLKAEFGEQAYDPRKDQK